MADCARCVITSCWTLLPRVPSPALVKITWPDGVDPTVARAWKPPVTSTPPVTAASPMTDKAGSRSGPPGPLSMSPLAPVAKVTARATPSGRYQLVQLETGREWCRGGVLHEVEI